MAEPACFCRVNRSVIFALDVVGSIGDRLESGVSNTSVCVCIPGGILATCQWEVLGSSDGIRGPGIFHSASMTAQEPGLGDKTVW